MRGEGEVEVVGIKTKRKREIREEKERRLLSQSRSLVPLIELSLIMIPYERRKKR